LAWCRCLWLATFCLWLATFFARIVTFDASPFVAHVGCNCRSNRFGFGDLEQKRNNLSGGTAAN
jgi:hypothetical protein